MSPAPRKVSDDEVLMAVSRAMARVSPSELTLGVIADEAGVTAAALVQRFGSKRALLLRVAEAFAGAAPMMFEQLRQAHRAPLDVVRAYAECMGDLATTPAALARSLAYLQADIADPDLRATLKQNALDGRREIAKLLEEAVSARQLARSTPVEELAQTIEHIISGALLTWAIHQNGTAKRWLRNAVDGVLRPWLRSG